MDDPWAALASYQSYGLSGPLSITSFDLITAGITCNLIGIVQHIDRDPDRTRLALTDYGAVSLRLTLWRNRAQWARGVVPGDVVLATEVRIQEHQGRCQGSMTDLSRLFDLRAPIPSSPSLVAARVRELLAVSGRMFPRPSPSSPLGDDRDPPPFDSLDDALRASPGGVYVGLARVRVRLPLRSAAETAAVVVQRGRYCEVPILIDDRIEGMASPAAVRMLCADLCPSDLQSDVLLELLRCLNAAGNSPFHCRIVSRRQQDRLPMAAVTLVSLRW